MGQCSVIYKQIMNIIFNLVEVQMKINKLYLFNYYTMCLQYYVHRISK